MESYNILLSASFCRQFSNSSMRFIHVAACITSWFLFITEQCSFSEKAMAPHSSTLAWKISWTEEPGRLQSMGSLRIGHDWVTSLSLFTFMHWRRKWQPTPVFLPGESQGQEPGGLPSMGSHRVGHDWSDLAAAAEAMFFRREISQFVYLRTCWWIFGLFLVLFVMNICIPIFVKTCFHFLKVKLPGHMVSVCLTL